MRILCRRAEGRDRGQRDNDGAGVEMTYVSAAGDSAGVGSQLSVSTGLQA